VEYSEYSVNIPSEFMFILKTYCTATTYINTRVHSPILCRRMPRVHVQSYSFYSRMTLFCLISHFENFKVLSRIGILKEHQNCSLLAWDESVHLVYTIKMEYSMLNIGYMQQCLPVGEIPTAHASRTNKHNIMQVEQLLNCSKTPKE
jgi:hypothetical protein